MEPAASLPQDEKENFVTVVSVGTESSKSKCEPFPTPKSGYVTVLTIGDNDENCILKDVIEEVLVYRLPGERLGFGLKFEGGTKANEFVKRLFIQSCAPDSPASRVQSSWGKLTEGDEVLEIDCMPVNTMTRIDCVRCLKDSNVVIKLLVRHFTSEPKNKSVEDLPLVISAEKKRTPPPPPPVPPRKIPKKFYKNQQNEPVPAARDKKKFQSPRSSGRASQSPDVSRRDRRFFDGSLGPPDAEVYVDLFSQESTQSLSESDDTGSSISTVVDRFGSFPTTTTSSLAGSLPSTPTSVQKQIDFTNLFNSYEDEDFSFNMIKHDIKADKIEEKSSNVNEECNPLQPPSSFQDAPLSYGNEDMRIEKSDQVGKSTNYKFTENDEEKVLKKPPVPPRSRDMINYKTKEFKIHDENMNISNLPRLVDFVPKSRESFDNPIEMINSFLENERRDTDYLKNDYYGDDDIDAHLDGYNEIDVYSSKWSLSSQLATIGEVEEEQDSLSNRSPISSTPIVIVENADNDTNEDLSKLDEYSPSKKDDEDINGKMETLPSDSRQPPDGHEFPDYIENAQSKDLYSRQLEKSKNAAQTISSESANWSQNRSSFSTPLAKATSVSNSDLSCFDIDSDEVTLRRPSDSTLHARSQSLIDMSSISSPKVDRWSLLAEQRRKSFSKLKGLVIPEHVSETEPTPAVNIPEIISHTTTSFVLETKVHANETTKCHSNETEPVALPLKTPPWVSNTNTIPKYSPAFKRKNLQVYTQPKKPEDLPIAIEKTQEKVPDKSATVKSKDDELLSDSPKSLESITSPTRSDCSFDYITSNRKRDVSKLQKDIGKSEDESDNDSAVSSSQSSYISRCSPPPSPTRSCEMLDYEVNIRTKPEIIQDADKYTSMQCRLLKAASVEAINRKNILASAKCRSGRDLKVGSPVIQRKYEEDGAVSTNVSEVVPETPKERPVKEKIASEVNGNTSNDVKTALGQPALKTKTERSHFVTLKPVPENPKNHAVKSTTLLNNKKSMSVTDLRKSFEKFGNAPPPLPQATPVSIPKEPKPKSRTNIKPDAKPRINGEVATGKTDVKPKPTPSALPAKEEKQEPASAANKRKIVLCPEFVGGSIGITLAGGTDYETKEITVHKIRYGSVAYNDGQLKKGDKVVSINGKSTANLTHAESVELLKEPVARFVLIVEEGKEDVVASPQRKSISSDVSVSKSLEPVTSAPKSVTHVIKLGNGCGGLGFSIEGGKDSPMGDLPIRVKKIFQGGRAEKNGELCVGDELLAINEISVTNLSRIETWSMMKKLSDGDVTLHIHR